MNHVRLYLSTFVLIGPLLAGPATVAAEVAPLEVTGSPNLEHGQLGKFSERTLVLAVEVDRFEARIVQYTLKDRPFMQALGHGPSDAHDPARRVELEIDLVGPNARHQLPMRDIGPLCFDHGPEADPHVEGDTIRLHRDVIIVEAPEIPGFAGIEVTVSEHDYGTTTRRPLGLAQLDASRYSPAGGQFALGDLLVAGSVNRKEETRQPAAPPVIWPEAVGESQIYWIYGNPDDGARRVNIVIVPDGYRYPEDKALLQQHADSLVRSLRATTPYKEHHSLINYTLVYAYSQESGTDQCDCDIIRNTAMGTRFPTGTTTCRDSENRCLYYTLTGTCDDFGIDNIVSAELRAPFHDETIIMVNTDRRGGCAGFRSVYSAAHSVGVHVAAHELSHSVAGLADEYQTNEGCGPQAGEINTSLNAVVGSWPEWIDDLGPPKVGAQYWSDCIYRPESECKMRSSTVPLCAVCNQRWALTIFRHPRVSPWAPVTSVSPEGPVQIVKGDSVRFSVETRTGLAREVITWSLDSPNLQGSLVSITSEGVLERSFDEVGEYTMTCEVVADRAFVKPSKDHANRDVAWWDIEVFESICDIGCGEGHPECDLDGDQIGNNCDADDDDDGHADESDNCPLTPNATQEDSDTDGLGDACDNCPGQANPRMDCDGDSRTSDEQCDADNDGMGDSCDSCTDPDGDGLGDSGPGVNPEECPADNCPYEFNPREDCDDDPESPDEQCDRDADGVGDVCDSCPNDPSLLDFDGDGIGDACEDGVVLADVDNSGRVDGLDLFTLGRSLGAEPGDLNYDPRVDLNRDLIVDGMDLESLTAHFGRTNE